MSEKQMTFLISDDLAEKFEIALTLRKEKADQVIETFIRSYVVDSFSTATRELTKSTSGKVFGMTSREASSSAMTLERIEAVYAMAKQIFNGSISRVEGNLKVAEATGMKLSSVSFYTSAFFAMMEGKEFKRAINQTATRYYIENISKDFGEDYFRRAIEATRLHLRYMKEVGGANLPGQERLLDELESEIKK